jgi:hypothetical protein
MTSRRRNSNKNLGNSISDVRRRLKYLERKPIRTKLQNRVIKAAAIAPSSITADEVDFGTALVTTENPADVVDNPKDGLLVIDPDTNGAFIYSEEEGDYVEIKDATAQASADGKNTIYRQASQPSGGTYVTGDVWFDTDDDNKIYRYNSATTTWVGFTLGNNALASISASKITAGTIDASVITVSNINAGNISTGVLSAITIRGNTIQQGSSGNYILMDQTDKATIKFYVTGYTYPGYISVESSFGGTLGQMSLQGPTTGSETDPASIGLYGENMYLDAGYINIESTGNFTLGNSSDGVHIKYDITVAYGGSSYINSIRNIWHSPNSYTPGGSDGMQGDVWLTY